MKILFRISKLHNGGTEQVFISLAKEFVHRYSCSVIFVTDNSEGVLFDNLKNSKLFQVHSLEAKNTLRTIFKFSNYIKNNKPDVIISAFTDTNAAAVLSKLLANSSPILILTEHSSIIRHWSNKGLLRVVKNFIYFKFIYRFSHHVVGVSKGVTQELSSMVKGNIRFSTIYNPIRLSPTFSRKIECSQNEKIILSVGRVAEQKDYITFVKSLDELRKKNVIFKAIILGGVTEDVYYENLRAVIAELDLVDEVNFLPFCDNIYDVYKSADVFVLSSAWEGFGNVIVEALSAGLPVVSTNCNFGPSEILQDGDYGLLVPVGDFVALAEAIFKQLYDPKPNLEQRLERSKFFSESKAAESYYALIQDLKYKA